MRVEILSITPAMAKRWLVATGESNFRKIKTNAVARMVRDIQNGDWEENGEAIVLNGNVVLDGQHRLTAFYQSGKTVRSVVVRDASATLYDVGATRSTKDYLKNLGVPCPDLSAATTRLVAKYDADDMEGMLNPRSLTVREALTFFTEHEDEIVEAAKKTAARNKTYAKIGPGSALSSARVIFRRLDEEATDAFFESLVGNLEDLEEKSPIRSMSRRLRKARNGLPPYPDARCVFGNLIRAWNSVRIGEQRTNYSLAFTTFPRAI